ncbi:MAG: branched-chain amino acid ABC transporter permease [Anaerolineae bacterium]
MNASMNFRQTIKIGLIAGLISLSTSAIGMVETFAQRDLISGFFSLGHLLIFLTPIGAGYLATRMANDDQKPSVYGHGALVGFISSLPVISLILLTILAPDIRSKLINVSPELISFLTFGQGSTLGSLILIMLMVAAGFAGAAVFTLSDQYRRPLLRGISWVLGLALASEILRTIFLRLVGTQVLKIVFGSKGLTPLAAVIVFVGAIAISLWWWNVGESVQNRMSGVGSPVQINRVKFGLLTMLLLALPFILGTYLTEVADNVGIYILMGLGLNIVVGYAGLLDLGYVAFFAIGAYSMGLLTSQGDLGIAQMSFWAALPICVGVSVLAGIILGTPVLGMRGDYLAIVTLGFGEIIRVLATSDVLKGVIGGAQGVLRIPKAQVAGTALVQPEQIYYLILIGVAIAAFISTRLRDSRLGRQWMAMREDEDVAEAMGIKLVSTKLLAFAIGAAFSGLSGAIFASKLGSIFPNSFSLFISINVLSLIIVGGIGSLPGVVVGAMVLVGLPELLREFAEYRNLMLGFLLIAMMLAKPEGLWPSAVLKRELHGTDEKISDEPELAASG